MPASSCQHPYPAHLPLHMMVPMTSPLIVEEPALKIIDYAAHLGVNQRTVRDWLANGQLPDAYKDGRGTWWIPASARKREAIVAPRVDPPAQHSTDLAVITPVTPPEFIPLYMPITQAAVLLGVTAFQIVKHRDEFGVQPWGDGGALVVPVRRLLGLAS